MNIIVAVNSDWGIGFKGTQAIVIPGDRRRFKQLTENGVVITGRKTYEDFRKPLPNRKNIILTHDGSFKAEGAVVRHSVSDVLTEIADEDTDKVFVIGGGSIYEAFLPYCSAAYVTRIEAAPPSDTFFPNLDEMPDWFLETVDGGFDYTMHGDEGAISCGEDGAVVRYSFNKYRRKDI